MTAAAPVRPHVAAAEGDALWFLGTVARVKLTGEQTGGRFALWEGILPHGAAPPLHSHQQDETFYVLDGQLTVWIVAPDDLDGDWLASCAHECRPGAAIYAPAGTPHSFRVESDTARLLFLSTPAGVEDYVRALAEPARWPWLQPPSDGPRVEKRRLEDVERELGVVRHAPAPPPAVAPPAGR